MTDTLREVLADHAADMNAEHGYGDHCGERCVSDLAARNVVLATGDWQETARQYAENVSYWRDLYETCLATTTRLAREDARSPGAPALDEARAFLALTPSGHTGANSEIPWFTHCGISHGADRPDCVVCKWLAASQPVTEEPRDILTIDSPDPAKRYRCNVPWHYEETP